eukprot:5630205-Ditylum_brightwellii.AAC.1
MEWPQEKTGSTNIMTFSRDKDGLEVDIFHNMACYLLTQEGKYTSGAADKVTTSIEACVGKVEEVTPHITSSGSRIASSDEIVFHLLMNVVGARWMVLGGRKLDVVLSYKKVPCYAK